MPFTKSTLLCLCVFVARASLHTSNYDVLENVDMADLKDEIRRLVPRVQAGGRLAEYAFFKRYSASQGLTMCHPFYEGEQCFGC